MDGERVAEGCWYYQVGSAGTWYQAVGVRGLGAGEGGGGWKMLPSDLQELIPSKNIFFLYFTGRGFLEAYIVLRETETFFFKAARGIRTCRR